MFGSVKTYVLRMDSEDPIRQVLKIWCSHCNLPLVLTISSITHYRKYLHFLWIQIPTNKSLQVEIVAARQCI